MNTPSKKKLPTIHIRGKEYVLVKDRILAFHEAYPKGSIQTSLITPPESKFIVIKAIIIPDVGVSTRVFTGYSQTQVGGNGVNETAALENAETSAVGRALAMLGIGVLESVASADEIHKSSYTPRKVLPSPPPLSPPTINPNDLPPCPHGHKRTYVKPGISKLTGKPRSGFFTCDLNQEELSKECLASRIWEDSAEEYAANYKQQTIA